MINDNQTNSSSGNNMKMLIFVIPVVLVLLAAGAYLVYAQLKPSTNKVITKNNTVDELMVENSQSADNNAIEEGMDKSVVKTFNITASNYSFEPATLLVSKGDKIKIVLNSTDSTHDWNLDEFNLKSGLVNASETKEIEFTADQSGTFEYYCSIGNHRSMGMVGTLIVN